jgi:hypothetical protein
MGFHEAEKPMCPKEFVGPTVMIVSTADTLKADTFAQNTSNPTSYPRILTGKGPLVAMLKVFKPSSETAIHSFNDLRQAVAIAASSSRPNGIPEFSNTFLARPTRAALEMIAKKVKSFSRNPHIHQPGLFRMQSKTPIRRQLPNPFQGVTRLLLVSTDHHKIICVADHLKSGFCHGHIHRVQIQIRQQGTDDSTNAKGNFEFIQQVPFRAKSD